MASLDGGQLLEFAETLTGWAPNIPDQGRLLTMVNTLVDLGHTLRGTAMLSPYDCAMRDARQALLALHLKGIRDLRVITGLALGVVVPDALIEHKLRSPHKVLRDQLRLDMAFALLLRDQSFNEAFIRCMWADASPQGAYDFMLMKYRRVPASRVMDVAAAISTLATTGGGCTRRHDEGFEPPLGEARKRRDANNVLAESVEDYLCAPRTLLNHIHTCTCRMFFCVFVYLRVKGRGCLGTMHSGTRTCKWCGQSCLHLPHVVSGVLGHSTLAANSR